MTYNNERHSLLDKYDDMCEIAKQNTKTNFEKNSIELMLSLLTFKFGIKNISNWYSYYKTETDIDVLMKKTNKDYYTIRESFDKINNFIKDIEYKNVDCSTFIVTIKNKELNEYENKLMTLALDRFLRVYLKDGYDIVYDRIVNKKKVREICEKYRCSNKKVLVLVKKIDDIKKKRTRNLEGVYKNLICFSKNTSNKEIAWE